MALRFRKTIRILPGVRINISKSGISTSVGPRGATVNFKGRKRKLTTGVPGTGFSQQHEITPKTRPTRSTTMVWLIIGTLLFIVWVFK